MSKRQVLIPLDGTEISAKILPEIEKNIILPGTTLILLHVIDWPGYPLDVPVMAPYGTIMSASHTSDRVVSKDEQRLVLEEQQLLQDNAETDLEILTKQLRQRGYSVQKAIRFGNPAQEILNIVKNQSIDLVAMTTHAREGIQRLLLGSVAETVLHHINIPILLLHPTSKRD